MSVIYNVLEFILIFIIFPLIFFFNFLPHSLIITVLWLVCFYTIFVISRKNKKIVFDIFKKEDFFKVLKRFILIAVLLLLVTYTFFEEKLFVFPLENTKIYFFVMFLYPILSVIPQEFIFRRFFLYRYEAFFYPNALIVLNAFLFGFMHIVFENYIAVLLSIVGGVIFMNTYLKTKSFSLVCIEHTLYGNLIFTLGLGEFFYHGNI